MICSEIHLKNFRCFESIVLVFKKPIVLLHGLNGSGKTSLLEALYYACYLRSFRTHLPTEMVRYNQLAFSIRLTIKDGIHDHEVRVGFSDDKRSVKIDKKTIDSYKELLTHYRVVSLIEDDLTIIKGGPHERRSFIDQALLLLDSTFALTMKEFRKIVNNRNSLLQHTHISCDNYVIWTQQLWEKSRYIREKREQLLKLLMQEVDRLGTTYFKDTYNTIIAFYQAKLIKNNQTFIEFIDANSSLFEQERLAKRSLFGAHLDDFTFSLKDKKTKRMASRGQQKCIVLLLKIALAQLIITHKGSLLFLLDDFMTDLDPETVKQLLRILENLKGQLVFTTPSHSDVLTAFLKEKGAQEITVTHSIKEPN